MQKIHDKKALTSSLTLVPVSY